MDTCGDMDQSLITAIAPWPDAAQRHFSIARQLVYAVATDQNIGPLEESLKWGQPAWRPAKARTGSTLRLYWSASDPRHLAAYVDCKTDIAAQMALRFADQFNNDGRRALAFSLEEALPEDAFWQLAHLTLCYHRLKRRANPGT